MQIQSQTFSKTVMLKNFRKWPQVFSLITKSVRMKNTTTPRFFNNLIKYVPIFQLPESIRHFDTSHHSQRPRKGPKILHFDTSLQPSVTSKRVFDPSSLPHVISTIRLIDLNPSVSWVVCRSDGLSKWRVKVTVDQSQVSKLRMFVKLRCRGELLTSKWWIFVPEKENLLWLLFRGDGCPLKELILTDNWKSFKVVYISGFDSSKTSSNKKFAIRN